MKVSIEHRETTTGMIFQKPAFEVKTTVEFSAEERAILQHQNLLESVVVDREPSASVQRKFKGDMQQVMQTYREGGLYALRVKDLLKGPDVYDCNTMVGAKVYEKDLTEGLQQLKKLIMHSATPAANKTFEL